MRFVPALAASFFAISGAACTGGDLSLPDNQFPAAIIAFGGSGQSGLAGAELPDPLVARVDDAEGRPVPDVQVAFELADGAEGGSIAPDTAVTDEDGEAVSHWVLGDREGRQTVEAAVVGQGLDVVSFTATATAEPEPPTLPDHLAFRVPPSDSEKDEPISPAVEVALVNADGNSTPVGGIEIEMALIDEAGHDHGDLGGTTIVATGENGIAVFTDLEVDRDRKNYRLRASVPALPELGSILSDTFDVED
jgi:hypothetical protein